MTDENTLGKKTIIDWIKANYKSQDLMNLAQILFTIALILNAYFLGQQEGRENIKYAFEVFKLWSRGNVQLPDQFNEIAKSGP